MSNDNNARFNSFEYSCVIPSNMMLLCKAEVGSGTYAVHSNDSKKMNESFQSGTKSKDENIDCQSYYEREYFDVQSRRREQLCVDSIRDVE